MSVVGSYEDPSWTGRETEIQIGQKLIGKRAVIAGVMRFMYSKKRFITKLGYNK